uniref:Uncharacterized protein n=1 Tax=Oryza brachyantha TaxID=4533 RepID=J3LW25_ORYBR
MSSSEEDVKAEVDHPMGCFMGGKHAGSIGVDRFLSPQFIGLVNGGEWWWWQRQPRWQRCVPPAAAGSVLGGGCDDRAASVNPLDVCHPINVTSAFVAAVVSNFSRSSVKTEDSSEESGLRYSKRRSQDEDKSFKSQALLLQLSQAFRAIDVILASSFSRCLMVNARSDIKRNNTGATGATSLTAPPNLGDEILFKGVDLSRPELYPS